MDLVFRRGTELWLTPSFVVVAQSLGVGVSGAERKGKKSLRTYVWAAQAWGGVEVLAACDPLAFEIGIEGPHKL